MKDYRGFDMLKMVQEAGKYLVSEDFSYKTSPEGDDCFLIVPNMALVHSTKIAELFSEYYLHEIFDLSSCYKGRNEEQYSLWHISKESTQSIRIGVFYGAAHQDSDDIYSGNGILLPSKFTRTFEEYCEHINRWMEDGSSTPQGNSQKYEFNVIDYSEFNSEIVYARYYRRDNAKLRKLEKSNRIVPLGSVATVTWSGFDRIKNTPEIEVVRTLHNQIVPKYPFDPKKDIRPFPASTERIHKGDIVVYADFEDFYLLNEEPSFDLYALGKIIRAKTLPAEYLYLYLKSEIGKQIKNELTIIGGMGRIHLYKAFLAYPYESDNLVNLPVVLPERDFQYYINEFKKIASPGVNHYPVRFEIPLDTIEDILSSKIIKQICTNNDALVKSTISDDIAELNICYKNGAYKAAVIMCGSILEAFLVDWLSELKGEDFFQKDFQVRKYDREKKQYVMDENGQYIYVRADLSDYIREISVDIRTLKQTSWSKEAQKAHEIRKKRNLVHTKLCVRGQDDINEEVCRQMIDNLKYITNSRWKM